MITIPFKLQDCIYHVFQNFRSSNIPIFGNMAYQQYWSGRFFGEFDQFCGTLSNLRNTPGTAFDIIAMQGLDRIDDHNIGLHSLDLSKDILCFGFCKNKTIIRFGSDPFCTHFDLLLTFLTRNIKRFER